jgi:IS5 family transposase
VQVNLAYRWFCGLGIEDRIPDHSTFTRARNERFRDGDIFRLVFERVVATCIAAGLVGGKGFAVDASLIVADANKCRSTPGDEWSHDIDPKMARRAVQDYLAHLDDPAWGAATEARRSSSHHPIPPPNGLAPCATRHPSRTPTTISSM